MTMTEAPPMTQPGCGYCEDWNRRHPNAPPRTSCGACASCGAPGHIGAHPRRPASICLCEGHWAELTAPGYRFELYHLVYLFVLLTFAAIAYPLVAKWF